MLLVNSQIRSVYIGRNSTLGLAIPTPKTHLSRLWYIIGEPLKFKLFLPLHKIQYPQLHLKLRLYTKASPGTESDRDAVDDFDILPPPAIPKQFTSFEDCQTLD